MISRKRHLAKAFTYRIVGSIITASVAWFLTGDVKVGGTIGVAEFFSKIFLYYLHERLWYRCKWGVEKTNEE
jgi:uncharacterized membrane protein